MLKLAEIFQSGMVIQRDEPIPIWGSATVGAEICIELRGIQRKTTADEKGAWTVKLPPFSSSEDEVLKVSDGEEDLILEHVAIGEVWIAGGQSNMEFFMRYEKHLKEVKEDCTNPRIRFYDVPEVAYEAQREQFDYSTVGIWREASTDNIEYFSAVGYYFARALEADQQVPIGIIGCNWGGTVAASWMQPDTVRKAGPAWTREYEDFVTQVDWNAYWERQKHNPMNSRGNFFSNPFNEFMMPQTHTVQELIAYFSERGMQHQQMENTELMPSHFPGSLYEHMLKTVAPYGIRGFLWYQGESDDVAGRQGYYKDMLTGLIADWRHLWGDRQLPFLVVQLPGFEHWLHEDNDAYDLIRSGQEQVTKEVPATWLCSISDIGEQYDIHPKNKKTVGERLALLARGHVYGQQLLCDAPTVRSFYWEDQRLVIAFDHAEGGLVLRGDTIAGLEILTEGKKADVTAMVEGENCVIAFPTGKPRCLQVLFARDKFFLVNLYNQAGIPAIPFEITMENG
jgi:sialate O-acetylesterase